MSFHCILFPQKGLTPVKLSSEKKPVSSQSRLTSARQLIFKSPYPISKLAMQNHRRITMSGTKRSLTMSVPNKIFAKRGAVSTVSYRSDANNSNMSELSYANNSTMNETSYANTTA